MKIFKLNNLDQIFTIILQIGWSGWFTVVLISNLFDLFYFSGNFALIQKTTSIYQVPYFINLIMFNCILIWQILITILFWSSCYLLIKKVARGMVILKLAYLSSTSLWFSFLIADEIFKNYMIEATHTRFLLAQLITLILILILSNTAKKNEVSDKR